MRSFFVGIGIGHRRPLRFMKIVPESLPPACRGRRRSTRIFTQIVAESSLLACRGRRRSTRIFTQIVAESSPPACRGRRRSTHFFYANTILLKSATLEIRPSTAFKRARRLFFTASSLSITITESKKPSIGAASLESSAIAAA